MKINFSSSVRGALIAGSLLLAGSMAGCSSKNTEIKDSSLDVLEGTVLEDTYVITDSNDDVFLVRSTTEWKGREIFGAWDDYANHYIDILSNNCYHQKSDEVDGCYHDEEGILPMNIVSMKPISLYLTEEDLTKKEFSEEDIIEIIMRAKPELATDNASLEDEAVQYKK